MAGEHCGEAFQDERLLTQASGKMTDDDRQLARVLASIEFFGEPDADLKWSDDRTREIIPPWARFLAYNLRDPKNRAALKEALERV